MDQKSVATSQAPGVDIQSVQGSLQVKGWDRPEVQLRSNAVDTAVLEKQNDQILVRCQGDCVLRVPLEASVHAGTVQGNASFKMLEGKLEIGKVHGSLEMRDIDTAQVGSVQGNLLVKQVSNDLGVEQVQGSAIARDVQGKCTLQKVSGNLDLGDTEGDVVAAAQGNTRVELCPLAGKNYTISATGDLQCLVPPDASLRVDFHSRGRRIRIRRPEEKITLAEDVHQLVLGKGEAHMSLNAGGSILFACQEADWAEMEDIQDELDEAFTEFSEEVGQRVTDQVDVQIETQMEILSQHLSKLEALVGKSGMPEEEAERVLRRAREASERASRRAQERMRRAQIKLERKLGAAQRKAEHKMKAGERHSPTSTRQTWKFEWPTPPVPPTPPAGTEAVSDAERLMILQMLEQKKITLAEAEQLLAALEGK